MFCVKEMFSLSLFKKLGLSILLSISFLSLAYAGEQRYEALSLSVRTALAGAMQGVTTPPEPYFESVLEKVDWLSGMSAMLPLRWNPTHQQRVAFLRTVRYEAQRSGLDPQLVLALIEVESYFRRYAISKAGAMGYMQVMPFWVNLIGDGNPSRLFDMRANLRYGCTILRYYLDMERGNLFRALGRYNGSTGRPEYPNAVLRAWRKWAAGVPVQRRGSAQAANTKAPAKLSLFQGE